MVYVFLEKERVMVYVHKLKEASIGVGGTLVFKLRLIAWTLFLHVQGMNVQPYLNQAKINNTYKDTHNIYIHTCT